MKRRRPEARGLSRDDDQLLRGVRRDAILALARRRATFRIDRPFARALGLTRRTLRAEVDRLIDDGEPLARHDEFVSRHTGGRTRVALDLTDDELTAILHGLRRLAEGAPDRQLMVEAAHLIHRIAAGLPQRDFARLRGLGGFDVRPDPGAPPPRALGGWEEAARAVAEERKLRFLCTDAAEARTARTVWPVRFTYHDTCLVAWCETREAFRTFRLDRMAEVVVKDDPLPRTREALLAAWRAEMPEHADGSNEERGRPAERPSSVPDGGLGDLGAGHEAVASREEGLGLP